MIDDYTSEIGALAGQRSSIAKVFVNDLDHNFGIYVELAYDVAYGCLRLNERTEDKFLLRQEIQTESFYILMIKFKLTHMIKVTINLILI